MQGKLITKGKENKMKNPLNKRLSRELKSEIGKYIVLFVFITGVIAIVSGFLVAARSLLFAYEESFEKYNVEDGNFELAYEADDSLINLLEKNGVTIYENFYLERETQDIDSTLRIFVNRDKVNKVCLMKGEVPEKANEIAIDRTYADNNDISVGDTLSVDNENFTVTGLVALSDYSSLYQNQSDMMFDAVKFGVAVMTEDGFRSLGENQLHYSYSWQYDEPPKNDEEAKIMAEDFLITLSANAVVTNYVPEYLNLAIQMVGDDFGKDTPMITMFLYIVVIIIAFIFAITTSNTISKEAAVIGTLRASGYTRKELLVHYLTMPILVTLISAVMGNILGYGWIKDYAADIVYKSYSLPTYVTLWNADAFVLTTVIPVIIMMLINFAIIANKLKLSPIKFIRRDLSKRKNKKALRLNTKIGIMKRFRIRIILQNIPNYITIIIGIFMANVILLLGMALPELLEKNEADIIGNMICDYQYVLKTPVETDTENAEKYSVESLKTIEGKLKSETVTVFGIAEDSKYVKIDLDKNGIYISNTFADKFNINEGETITLKESYGEKEYSFKVEGIHYYPSGIAVFMNNEYFNETFEKESGYYNGYFSDEKISDIDDVFFATKITEDDMTKTSRQMEVSMGGMMDAFAVFGVIMFMLIIYLLSKIIIEKNAQSISMAKILGYSNKEIGGLYITSTSIVVIASLILTIPIANGLMKYVCIVMLSEFPGWIPYYVPFSVYVKMAVAGVVAYAVVAYMQFRKVKKIPMDSVLKNVE